MYRNMTAAYRGMFVVCAVALFCLMSVSQSAQPSCEDLVRPLDQLDPSHLEGRWALVAGSFINPEHLKFFKQRNSSSVNFSNAGANSTILYTPSVDAGGKCHYHSYNVSLEGSTLTFDVRDQVNLTVTFLHTCCPDCLVMRFDDTESKKPQRLFLFSRRRELEQKEMEQCRTQVECLNMLPPAVMDPNKELCPQQNISDPAAQTDAETERQEA